MRVRFDPIWDGTPRRLPHGEVVTRQGDEVRCLSLVLEPAVRLSAVTPSGREVVVGLLGAGEVFGEAALAGGPSPVRAEAVGDALVLAVPVEELGELIARQPATGEQLLRMLAARLHRTSIALEEALACDVPARVRGRLHHLFTEHGVAQRDGVRLGVPLTQVELARMVGASREAVNRSLVALRASGVLREPDGRLVSPDPEALLDERATG